MWPLAGTAGGGGTDIRAERILVLGSAHGTDNSSSSLWTRWNSGARQARFFARVSEVLPDIDSLTLAGVPLTCDATAYVTNGMSTAGLLRVGDADVALDPLLVEWRAGGHPVGSGGGANRQHTADARRGWHSRLGILRSRRASPVCSSIVVGLGSSIGTPSCVIRPASGPTDAGMRRTWPPLRRQRRSRTPIRASSSRRARGSCSPCLTGTLVKRLGCVEHVNLPEPVAFVAGIHVPPPAAAGEPARAGPRDPGGLVSLAGAGRGLFATRMGFTP